MVHKSTDEITVKIIAGVTRQSADKAARNSGDNCANKPAGDVDHASNDDANATQKVAKPNGQRSCWWKRKIAWAGIVVLFLFLSLAIAVLIVRERNSQMVFTASDTSVVLSIDRVVSDMIAGFDNFSFAVTNRGHVLTVGMFVAKRVSAVDGRVRVNFDAVAIGSTNEEHWETSVLVEFVLVGDGSRLKAGDINVRRIHIYDLPEKFGTDELEYNETIVSLIKDRIRSSEKIVFESQRIVAVELTVDDKVKITTGEVL